MDNQWEKINLGSPRLPEDGTGHGHQTVEATPLGSPRRSEDGPSALSASADRAGGLRIFDFRKRSPIHCGPESLWCLCPSSKEELRAAISYCGGIWNGPAVALGGCSNILMADSFAIGRPFVSLSELAFVQAAPPFVRAQAGAPLSKVVASSLAFSEALAPLSGIPGTLGGALVGNAGANGTQIGDFVESVLCLDGGGREVRLSRGECDFSYRASIFGGGPGLIIESAVLRLPPGDPRKAGMAASEALRLRRARGLGLRPSLGSFFKNPGSRHAGKLLEGAGLKGFAIGGAMVSPLHGNIITNPAGKADAQEVFALAEHCRKTVEKLYKINLEYEVVLYGFDMA